MKGIHLKIYHTDQPVPSLKEFNRSIFLAGPTPRQDRPVPSWRPAACELLKQMGFEGGVFSPEFGSGIVAFDYINQVEWEWACLHMADVVCFWVPRDLETLPAFTTNIEFGYYIDKKQTVYGRPDDAPKNSYLDWLYRKVKGRDSEVYSTLSDTLSAAVNLCRSGAPSCGNG